MAELTEEEYDALDEKWTKTTPKVGPNGTGFFAQRKAGMTAGAARSITVDSFTADYLLTKAIAAHNTPADIIGDLVREEGRTVQAPEQRETPLFIRYALPKP